MVSDDTYPKKTTTAVLVLFFSITFTYNLCRFLKDTIINVNDIFYISLNYLSNSMTILFLLFMSLYFVYLLDLKHNSREMILQKYDKLIFEKSKN